jgi:hypothetical protein
VVRRGEIALGEVKRIFFESGLDGIVYVVIYAEVLG